jgi:hypothetical protein
MKPLTIRTSDGKPIVLTSHFPGGVYYYVTGAGDGASTRGDGEACGIQVSGTDPSDPDPIDVDFLDSLYLEGGILTWTNARYGDWISMGLVIPATPAPVANGGGTGNCNLVALGGGAALIVPAAGNGAYDVDLATAIPVPAYNEESGAATGYWEWSDPDTGKGTVTASATPGSAKWNLLNFSPPMVRFINRFRLLGDGSLDLKPPIKPKKILPHWKFRTTVHSVGRPSGTLDIVWTLKTGRVQTS